jgi:hypothetical protein
VILVQELVLRVVIHQVSSYLLITSTPCTPLLMLGGPSPISTYPDLTGNLPNLTSSLP